MTKTIYNPVSRNIENLTESEFNKVHDETTDWDKAKTVVFKIGSDLLDENYIYLLAEQLSKIDKRKLIVSSGAIKTSKEKITIQGDRATNQAYAAIGQHMLMGKYANAFGAGNVGQVLFTDEDLRHPESERYQNGVSTLNVLMDNSIIPIVNENDTVSVEEIKVGDNDTLSALVANAIGADILVMLSKHGLYDKKPAQGNMARLINIVPCIDEKIKRFAGLESTGYGVGGMKTKVGAARIFYKKPVIVMDGKGFYAGSIPDASYEGTLFCNNNLRQDM